jgi:hypothetical protein
LEGKKLAVFGQRLYQNKVHLILIMPKGGRSLIPTEWTDFKVPLQDSPAQAKLNSRLGSIHDLLHARGVVDALLNRRTAQIGSDEKSADEENAHRATHAELSRHPHSGNSDMGSAGGGTETLGHRSSGTTDRPSNGRPAESEGR